MTLKELSAALTRIVTSAEAKERYRLADIMSAALSHHGEPHALDVMNLGDALANKIESLFPGTFTEQELELTIKASCYGHDIGRSEPPDTINGKPKDRHEYHGARIMNDFMVREGFPNDMRSVICYGIVHHRANGVLGRNALDPKPTLNRLFEMKRRTLSITVLADKCVGDAERVRTKDALRIKLLRALGLSRWYFQNKANQDEKNDFANYSIKSAQLLVDPNDDVDDPRFRGSIILKLDMDEKVCTLEDIFTVHWFSEAYHCCGKAAKVLGFDFRINANGETWYFSKETNSWAKRAQLLVPRV